MKKLLYTSIAVTTFFACRPEKDIQKKSTSRLFENQNIKVSGINTGESTSFPSRVNGGKQFVEELRLNSIPQVLPNDDYPDWISFKNFYYSKKETLSNSVSQFCSEQLLRSYNLLSIANGNKSAKQVIIENLTFLANNKYQGYKLIYYHLLWMKENNIDEYINIRNQVVSYAKPILGAPNPNLKNDPRIEANPEFKAEMEKMLLQVKQNDAFIEKIKLL